MQNESSFYMQQQKGPCYLTHECLNGGLTGRDGERLTWRRWLRLWQRWWPVVEQDERRRRKSAAGEGPAVVVAVQPLVRIWVCREAALPSFGGGGRLLWGLQGLKRSWREKEESNVGWKRKQRSKLIFSDFCTQISPPSGHEMQPYL